MRKLLATSLLTVSLTACSSLTPAGMRAVAGLDPIETDPARLTAAIGVDEAFRLRTGDAKLSISYRTDKMSSPVVSEEFKLVISASTGTDSIEPHAGEAIFVARIAEEDLARARDAQSRIKTLKQAGAGTGELSVSVSSGCLTKAMPDKVPLRTFIRSEEAAKFVQLTEVDNILDMLTQEQVKKIRQDFPAC